MKYKILKDGLVQGGSAQYLYDEDGQIFWEASIKVGMGFLAKTYSKKGTLLLEDPDLMLSENLKEGMEHIFGPVLIKTIKRGEDGLMECLISVEGGAIEGPVFVDYSDHYINPRHAEIVAKVSGLTLNIKLVPEE
ncbi:MAG: hypothetical protein EBZ49_00030 [Proteobacteria bacterium]|nr:hypothetical protein [Pseudomonadota bacterium]